MATVRTLGQIIDQFEEIADQHRQINNFTVGTADDFATSGTTQYPAWWVTYESMPLSERQESFTFTFFVVDRVKKDRSNLVTVHSDTKQICRDIVTQIRDPYYEWVSSKDISLEAIYEPFHEDELAGWSFTITIGQPFLNDKCEIPFITTPTITYPSYPSGGGTPVFYYVPNTRTLTINGVSYDLSQDRSWTISTGGLTCNDLPNCPTILDILADINGINSTLFDAVFTTGSYADPSWLTSLAWSKITGAPPFITSLNGAWLTTGNSLSGSEIFGSTNNQPVNIYLNNIQRAKWLQGGIFLWNSTTQPTVFSSTVANHLTGGRTMLGSGDDTHILILPRYNPGNTYAYIASVQDTTTLGTVGIKFQTHDASSPIEKNRIDPDGTFVNDKNVQLSQETASTIAHFDATKNIKSLSTSTYPSLTELSYVKGTTSAIQTQINALVGGVTYQGTWDAATNTPTITSSVGIKGYYYVVSVTGSTNIDGITDWKIGDWIIFNGTTWQKVDNTDAVISVNGQIGIVNLTSTDVGAQPLDSDLTAIAALTTTVYGRSLLTLANAAAADWLNKTANLSDLASVVTARANLGAPFTISLNGSAFNPADSLTYYFGSAFNAPTTTAANHPHVTPLALTVIAARIDVAGNAVTGTLENATMNLRNITTSTSSIIGTFTSNGTTAITRSFSYTGLNISVSAGNSIAAEVVCPLWATNPTSTRWYLTLYCIRA